MARQLQLRKGTADEHSTFTGASGELSYEETNKRVFIHDGVTIGGLRLAKLTDVVSTPNATETIAGKAKIATTAIAQDGVNDTDIMTPLKTLSLFNLKSLGVNQTWQNVTSSRASDTTYTNTTGKPIQIYIQGSVNGGLLSVGGSPSISTHGNGMSLFIIPAGATYRFSGGYAVWWELR